MEERFADIQLLRYEVPDFASLPLRQKLLIYHLSEAALLGRDILWDQNNCFGLEIRNALEAIYTCHDGPRDTADWQAFVVYLKRVWFSNGIHHHYSYLKLQPEFSRDFFLSGLRKAEAKTSQHFDADKLADIIFNPDVMPKRVNQADGDDLLLTSSCNYYQEGITQAEAEAFYADLKRQADTTRPPMLGMNSRLERKKSVAIVMREEYQDGWLHYSLFDTRKSENDKYKGFNLRNNGNRFVSDYFADALGGAILEGSGVDYQRSRQVVVFYNGKYFGIHDMRERFNKNYVESNYGIEASTVTMVKHLTETVTASNGTPDEYISMLELAADNDFSGDNNAFYAQLKTMMDVGNFADYMAAEMYIHNGDWPNNNVRAWRSPDNMWKFMIYDLDHGFNWDWNVAGFGQSTNMFDWVKQGGRSSGKCYTSNDKAFTGDKRHCFHVFYVRLIKNPDFKRLFLNHAAVMLQNYLNADVIEKVRAKMAGSIDETEAERDLAANGQKERGYGSFTVSNSSITEWARQRDIDMLQQYKSEFGLGEMVNMTISSNGNGSVLMEGMNLPGSTATSTKYTGKFFSGNQMEVTAVPSNGAVFTGWSDGSTDNPHLVNITEGQTITANFK